tara:strand:- start:354 stop:500 length:147 start_codon:yes stop_codon:yes gene_type:complete
MNDEVIAYNIDQIIFDWRFGYITKSQAIKDIMSLGFTKKHARNLLEGE